MKGRPIEEGFTLPEGRKACRATDVPVSTKEYKSLRDLGDRDGGFVANVKVNQIIGRTFEGCERVIVERGEGPKAAKASSLRKHDVEKGSQTRIEKIGREIIDAIISDFQTRYTVNGFLNGETPYEDCPRHIDNIQVLLMGWAGSENHDALQSPSEDRRKNFLYNLQRSVEIEVDNRIAGLLRVEFNGESIWDDWTVKVKLNTGGCGPDYINANVFFAKREEADE